MSLFSASTVNYGFPAWTLVHSTSPSSFSLFSFLIKGEPLLCQRGFPHPLHYSPSPLPCTLLVSQKANIRPSTLKTSIIQLKGGNLSPSGEGKIHRKGGIRLIPHPHIQSLSPTGSGIGTMGGWGAACTSYYIDDDPFSVVSLFY